MSVGSSAVEDVLISYQKISQLIGFSFLRAKYTAYTLPLTYNRFH